MHNYAYAQTLSLLSPIWSNPCYQTNILFYAPLYSLPRTLSQLYPLPGILFVNFRMVDSSLLLSLSLNIFSENYFLIIQFEITPCHITFFYVVISTCHFFICPLCLFSMSPAEYKLHEKMGFICFSFALFTVLRKGLENSRFLINAHWKDEWLDEWLSFICIIEKDWELLAIDRRIVSID